MTDTLLALVAFSPIVVAAVLLVGLNWPAKRAMPIAFILTVFIALWGWQMSPTRVLASSLQGLIITVTVLWIVFGAILMLNTLKHTGAIAAIRGGFTNISPDRRIQAPEATLGDRGRVARLLAQLGHGRAQLVGALLHQLLQLDVAAAGAPRRPAHQAADQAGGGGQCPVKIPPSGIPLEEIERAALIEALKMSNWVQKDAAELLDISPRVMNYKIKTLNIEMPRRRVLAASA